jgi:hypothetical protein
VSPIAPATAVAAALLLASVAAGAAQVAGATYAGSLGGSQSKVAITLHVSSDGRRVQTVQLSRLPIYCAGGGPPSAQIVFAAAPISRSGGFVANGRDTIAVGPLKGTVVATVTLTGTFGPGRHESGTVSTRFGGSGSRCSGSSRYRTRIRPTRLDDRFHGRAGY